MREDYTTAHGALWVFTPPMLIRLHKPTFSESLFRSLFSKRSLRLLPYYRHKLMYFDVLSHCDKCSLLQIVSRYSTTCLSCQRDWVTHNACTCIYLFKAFKTMGCGSASAPCLRQLAPIKLVDNTINQWLFNGCQFTRINIIYSPHQTKSNAFALSRT